jgi:predicted negative regulator of RcsB-dependent stress response
LELRGALLSAQGNGTEAAATFEQTTKAEKDLGYREPPIYIRPVYESQGAALISRGNWLEARKAYEKALLGAAPNDSHRAAYKLATTATTRDPRPTG